MWIAKPIQALSAEEKNAWRHIEIQAPLAQSLCWAKAIEAVAGRTYVVFNPEEGVGGMVYSNTSSPLVEASFECINGPILDWDNPRIISRQFATFAMAVSKLSRNFKSLTIKPRWTFEQAENRLKLLPIEPSFRSQAATLLVPILKTKEEQFKSFTSRMRRTISYSCKNGVKTQWELVNPQNLEKFVLSMKEFGTTHNFTVPPLKWFQALTSEGDFEYKFNKPSFWIATAQKHGSDTSKAETQILVCLKDKKAFYLFGYENRSPEIRSAISTSAAAQWETMTQCLTHQIESYDLNGYVVDADPQNPYYGVCRFKEQFSGQIVKYDCPEFIIT